ncbi:MAG: hypothetical protein ABL951_14120 [Alphaproteobacteria bacterium]
MAAKSGQISPASHNLPRIDPCSQHGYRADKIRIHRLNTGCPGRKKRGGYLVEQLVIHVPANKVFRAHVSIVLALILASLAGDIIHLTTGNYHSYGFRQLFHVGFEKKIPALFSAAALFSCCLMLLVLYQFYRKSGKDGYRFLGFLSIVFLFLSYDEAFSVHEKLSAIFDQWIAGKGLLSFTWVIPGMLFVIAVFLTSISFLRKTNAATRNLMILSGVIFVSGAAGFEAMSGWRVNEAALKVPLLRTSQPDLIYFLLSTCEELLEMSGIALFLFTLIRHFERTFGLLTLRIGAS